MEFDTFAANPALHTYLGFVMFIAMVIQYSLSGPGFTKGKIKAQRGNPESPD